MSEEAKKGITVKIDAALHAQVRENVEGHNMIMVEFVTRALDNELHPKNEMKEGAKVANSRTLAIQIPEELFQRIKEYLQRNNMTQRQFLIGLIEEGLDRDLTEREAEIAPVSEDAEPRDEDTDQREEAAVDGFSASSEEDAEEGFEEEEAVEVQQNSCPDFSMSM